jgi:16S rRNA (adenine1518-N6/adenine1519-N6)-dimethyltransferase
MNLSTLKRTLDELGVNPSKSLGQNFLHDQNLARWIVAQLDLRPDDHLIEVGPGLGALTEFALPLCKSMTLVEKDGRLAEHLRERFADDARVEVLHRDALDYDVRELWLRGGAKFVGNLPYYVTSEIMFRFIAEPCPVRRLVLTTQREFADRLAARPRTKDYGTPTVIVQRNWRVKNLRTLPASVFTPAPKVESSVILLTPRGTESGTGFQPVQASAAGRCHDAAIPECDGALFDALVRAGFSQRRKQLRKMLAGLVPDWTAASAHIGATETARAEELSVDQWIALTNFVRPVEITHAQDVHGERFPVVDENDNVTGEASRHEVHTRRLRHRAVHVFVFNPAGELFLQKRSQWKDAHPGRWDSSASGHVNAGDTYDATAPRELAEELGVVAPVGLAAKIPACEETGQEFVRLYTARHGGPFRLPRAEIETGGFFSVEMIRRWLAARPEDFATGFVKCFHAFESGRHALQPVGLADG